MMHRNAFCCDISFANKMLFAADIVPEKKKKFRTSETFPDTNVRLKNTCMIQSDAFMASLPRYYAWHALLRDKYLSAN